jgi:hypothetical protein
VETLPPALARAAGLPSGGKHGQGAALVDAFAAALLAASRFLAFPPDHRKKAG